MLILAAAALAVASAAPVAAPETPDAVTHHVITIGGRVLAYTARAGTIVLRDAQEHPTASVFYVAYTLDGGTPSTRPVTFMYNGGPGSSTMWLHMGSFGPMKVPTPGDALSGPPPYQLEENPDTLLDKTDLVFIDMPDSGFGRILSAGKPSMFFGVDEDAQAFAQFIQRYITTFSRWNSPKFLFGESYGTTRSAALVDVLQQQGINVNGVVLQSSILNFGLDYGDLIAGGDWGYIFNLPTETAVAWYHHALPDAPADLQSILPQVEQFALGEYSDALTKGASISKSEFDDVAEKLHRYTGLSVSYIRTSNLRVPYWRFDTELLRDQGLEIGRLDARFETTVMDRAASAQPWDPTDAAIDAPYTTAINEYLRRDLGYDTPLLYRTQIYDIIYANGGSWDFTHRGNPTTDVTPDLAEAMTMNPRLKIFSANGYFDFATPFFATVYTLQHLTIDPSLRSNITFGFYPTGHMIYLDSQALHQYHDDLERWYDNALGR